MSAGLALILISSGLLLIMLVVLLLIQDSCKRHPKNRHDAIPRVPKPRKAGVVAGVPPPPQEVQENDAITRNVSVHRFPNGKTIGSLHLAGLHPDEKYPSQIHNLPCGGKGVGDHHQHEKGGKVDAVNAIWLTFTTNGSLHNSQQGNVFWVSSKK